MPIEVICPGCKAQFQVSDKFAGQKGPCPKCKAEIEIPTKDEEVVIHAPAPAAKRDPRAAKLLQPIVRKETTVTTTAIVAVAGAVVLAPLLALVLHFGIQDKAQFPTWILAAGAILLAPPLVLAGYSFLRNSELEPFRGQSLAIRTAICAAVYALLWGLYAGVRVYVFDGEPLELFQYLLVITPFVLVGAFAAFASYDLDYGVGVIHYGLYVLVTMMLCLIAGAPLQ